MCTRTRGRARAHTHIRHTAHDTSTHQIRATDVASTARRINYLASSHHGNRRETTEGPSAHPLPPNCARCPHLIRDLKHFFSYLAVGSQQLHKLEKGLLRRHNLCCQPRVTRPSGTHGRHLSSATSLHSPPMLPSTQRQNFGVEHSLPLACSNAAPSQRQACSVRARWRGARALRHPKP